MGNAFGRFGTVGFADAVPTKRQVTMKNGAIENPRLIADFLIPVLRTDFLHQQNAK